jgi:hypothetical protein
MHLPVMPVMSVLPVLPVMSVLPVLPVRPVLIDPEGHKMILARLK